MAWWTLRSTSLLLCQSAQGAKAAQLLIALPCQASGSFSGKQKTWSRVWPKYLSAHIGKNWRLLGVWCGCPLRFVTDYLLRAVKIVKKIELRDRRTSSFSFSLAPRTF